MYSLKKNNRVLSILFKCSYILCDDNVDMISHKFKNNKITQNKNVQTYLRPLK